jgi:gamma-aminobutyric acid receptor subunit beta
MDLRNYPLDVQNCTVEIESCKYTEIRYGELWVRNVSVYVEVIVIADGYTTSEVLMKWNEPMPVHGVDQVNVPQFTILSYHTEDSVVETATGK